MKFYKSTRPTKVDSAIPAVVTGAASVAMLAVSSPSELVVDNPANVRGVASNIAFNMLSYYSANQTNSGILMGDLPEPYYWWEAGAMWGSMVDYYHYTGDPSYNDVVIEALTAKVNTGVNFDYMPEEHWHEEGNDDLGFWSYAVMAAAERNFPQPVEGVPSWLDLGKNIFDTLESRWNDTHCGGGMLWQIFDWNYHGLNYKNSVSNGGFFQLAARLARATEGADDKYVQWAERVWDWSEAVGLIDDRLNIYDGVDARNNCSDVNHLSFTYSTGIYLYGAAVLADVTGDEKWAARATGVLEAAKRFFWDGDDGPANVMYEPACETVDTCNVDMKSFKGYLARFMWQSTYVMPSLRLTVQTLLETSALAAAKTCTGGETGDICGQKWYVDGHDGSVGLGQQMCALETVQGLLIDETVGPFKGDEIKHVKERVWLQPPATEAEESVPQPSKRDDEEVEDKEDAAPGGVVANWGLVVLGLLVSAFAGYGLV